MFSGVDLRIEAGDRIVALAYPDAADPALDPQLRLARRHASIGGTVKVTATGRNLGRRAAAITVCFFRGAPDAGIPAGEIALPTVAFNQPFTATITRAVGDGPQPIFAQAAAAAGGNLDTGNDLATGDLSALPPPAAVYATADATLPNLVLVTIQPAKAEDVAGYRLLRSTSITGAYDLVAEAAGVQFVDAGLARGRPTATRCRATTCAAWSRRWPSRSASGRSRFSSTCRWCGDDAQQSGGTSRLPSFLLYCCP